MCMWDIVVILDVQQLGIKKKKTAKKKAPGIRFQQPTRMDYPLSYRCVDTWAMLQ